MKNIFDKLLYQALLIRRVEEKIIEIYPSDKILSPVHLSIGQEHHLVSLFESLTTQDKVFTTYRSHGVYLASGGDLKLFFSELYGKKTGMAKGKAGSMHLASPNTGVMGPSAVVGGTLPHALGYAYSKILNPDNNIVISVSGDGSTEEGVFHECLNFASLKNLPILFIVEDNDLAINIPKKKRQSYSLKNLSKAYNIPYYCIKNHYALKKNYFFFKKIVKNMRKKFKPVLVKINTHRYLDHVGIASDFDIAVREKKTLTKWHEKDPLNKTEKTLRFEKKAQKTIEEALNFAEKSNFASEDEVLKDVL